MPTYMRMLRLPVKKGLEVGKRLGAENYVFWGGREGYETLLNTDLQLEMDNMAACSPWRWITRRKSASTPSS